MFVPIEPPWRRYSWVPCVSEPAPAKFQRRMTPVKPRPRVVPRASTNLPGWKISSSFSVCPTSHLPANSAVAAELADEALGRRVRLLEEAGERLARVLLLALLEAEDERDVAVLLEGALAQNDDRARLDDGDARDAPVGLEELGRAEFAAEDAGLQYSWALLFACAGIKRDGASASVGARRPQAKGTGGACARHGSTAPRRGQRLYPRRRARQAACRVPRVDTP